MKENYAFIMEDKVTAFLSQKRKLEQQGWKKKAAFSQESKDGKIFGCAIFEWPEEKGE